MLTSAGDFGVYVHVPFCTRRCDYCAFATWTDRFHLMSKYVDACVAQLTHLTSSVELPPATSVFFGGGTPSVLEPFQVQAIIAAIDLAPGAEVTLECNPETVDERKLRGYREAGANRVSLGVQSMVPHVLKSLGREHSVDSVSAAVHSAAAAGFGSNYNVDLIFGAAGETMIDWAVTLEASVALSPAPSHISAYALTVEPGTPLARDVRRHPDPDDQADKYLFADSLLEQAGLSWYEISNWAKPGTECKHNQLYWKQGEYLGIGCAAHSHRVDPVTGSARRWWNVRTPDRFIRLVGDGRDPEAAGEDLDRDRRRFERLELLLRTRAGVPEAALPGWQRDPDLAGLLRPVADGRVALTPRGRLLANEVAMRLAA